MRLPSAVQAAAEKSDALAKQLTEGKSQPEPGTTPLPENGIPAAEERDTLPAGVDQTATDQHKDPEGKPNDKESEETYKQRYLSLKGRFDSEMPRLQQDNHRMQGLVADLERQVEQLSTVANQSTQNQSGDATGPKIDKEAFEEYGPEFKGLIETVESLQAENSQLKTKLTDLSGDITSERQRQNESSYQAYMSRVKAHVSSLGREFDAINSDQAFLNWLRQFPEGESEARFAKLKRAEANQDLEATKEIFTEYLGSPPKSTPQKKETPNIQPNPTNPGSDTNPPNPQNERVWTRDSIAAFYADKRRGVFKGREEEARALEVDIHAAAGEGRVRG